MSLCWRFRLVLPARTRVTPSVCPCVAQDVHPRDALHSTSTAFTVCLDHMMGLLSDPLCSPAVVGKRIRAHEPARGSSVVDVVDGRADGGSGDASRDGQVVVVDVEGRSESEEEKKLSASLAKALVLLGDADMMRRMLEKLLEFDEKKYTAMFQVRPAPSWAGLLLYMVPCLLSWLSGRVAHPFVLR